MEIKVEPIEAGNEPLLFVLSVPEKITLEMRQRLYECVDSVRDSMRVGQEIPWIVLDGGAKLELVKKTDGIEARLEEIERASDAQCTTAAQTE